MSADPALNLAEDRLFFLGTGLLYRAVCAPASWSAERVSKEVTRMDPPGTSNNRWVISDCSERTGEDDPFKGQNGIACKDEAGRRHWLLNC